MDYVHAHAITVSCSFLVHFCTMTITSWGLGSVACCLSFFIGVIISLHSVDVALSKMSHHKNSNVSCKYIINY